MKNLDGEKKKATGTLEVGQTEKLKPLAHRVKGHVIRVLELNQEIVEILKRIEDPVEAIAREIAEELKEEE